MHSLIASSAGRHILVAAELALGVVLASDAAQTSLKQATREGKLPARLLGFGMSLAKLGAAVVKSRQAPPGVKITPRAFGSRRPPNTTASHGRWAPRLAPEL